MFCKNINSLQTSNHYFMNIDIFKKYFPEINPVQLDMLQNLHPLYEYWNEKINVISRKDFNNFYIHHVLHSLSIFKLIEFNANSRILDIGTGGGFPGIPLAILNPDCQFHLVDSIGKKIKVVEAVFTSLGLNNVTCEKVRAEEVKGQFDFIVSRAVTAMPEFLQWTKGKLKKADNNILPNGILYLKGGDLSEELKTISRKKDIYEISNWFEEDFFIGKKIVHIY
jgi:16S rRNA (guanine527-N7)-methyltransferase